MEKKSNLRKKKNKQQFDAVPGGAVVRYVRGSARKARLVADMIRGMNAFLA